MPPPQFHCPVGVHEIELDFLALFVAKNQTDGKHAFAICLHVRTTALEGRSAPLVENDSESYVAAAAALRWETVFDDKIFKIFLILRIVFVCVNPLGLLQKLHVE